MYNRYIPQPDGSYRKNRMPEPPRPQPERPQRPKPQQPPEPPPCPPPQQEQPPTPPSRSCPRQRPTPPPPKPDTSVTGFLRRLLPKDFDTGDLLIVLLLLLMAGDCHEDQNTALLTLALYFFM